MKKKASKKRPSRRSIAAPFGLDRSKLQPKLQMIANGSSQVNAVRAELCPALLVTSGALLAKVNPRRQETDFATTAKRGKPLPPRPKQAKLAPDVEANVFVLLNRGGTRTGPIEGMVGLRGDIVSARLPLSRLPMLAADPRVAYIEIGEALRVPHPVAVAETPHAPPPGERRFGKVSQHNFGADVLVGIIDVGGFDFTHEDFLDAKGRTRFVAIWDQGGNARPSPNNTQFNYGAEFTKAHLDAAIKAAPGMGVPAYEIERQSQLAEGSHGTHVASIAAGNRGICREAPIAGVLIALRPEDDDRRKSFYDSTCIAAGLDYLVALAAHMKKNLVVNISLGTNGHAHDGSGAIGRWIDAILATPGRAVVVAAGNSGQEKGETPDDVGWIMGRIHTAGQLSAAGLTAELDWVVVGNGVVDISENEMELWFSAQDRIAVSLRTPQGEWIGPVEPHDFIENRRLPDGSFVSIYNELYHPSNGSNHIGIYLSPNLSADPVVGVSAGTWAVRVHGREIRDGKFDGWIERDDPRPWRTEQGREYWAFPSFFSERSLVDRSTVTSLACGHHVISVANLDSVRNRISPSSSQGPTRDGRFKPDVAAPGTNVVAARGFSQDSARWIEMTGTSMAAPFICGLSGLMIGMDATLTAAQIEGIIQSTAKPLPGASFKWADDAGFGVIDPEACLREVADVHKRNDRTES
jgi:subtilisin family serine protease